MKRTKLNNSEIIILSDLAFMVLLNESMEERKSEYTRLYDRYMSKISIEKRDLAKKVIEEFLYEDDEFCNNGCKVDIFSGWLSFEDIKSKEEARQKAIHKLTNGAFGKNLSLEEAINTIKDVKPYSNPFSTERKLEEISLKYCESNY